MERKTPRRLINPEPRIHRLESGSGRRGEGAGGNRLAILFSFSQSPLLSGPDTTERMGTYAAIYTGISGDTPFSRVAVGPELGNLISSPASTTELLCNLRQTLQHKLAAPGVRHELRSLFYNPHYNSDVGKLLFFFVSQFSHL